jgi:hypothetical protein
MLGVEPHGLTAVAPLQTLRGAEPSEAHPPSPRLRRVPTSHSSTGLHPWPSAKEGKNGGSRLAGTLTPEKWGRKESVDWWSAGQAARQESLGAATEMMLDVADVKLGSRVLDVAAGTGERAPLSPVGCHPGNPFTEGEMPLNQEVNACTP